jgi:TonB-linked SusC/RagA family outer membrane protein
MRKVPIFLCFAFLLQFLLPHGYAFAQTTKVTGKVTSFEGKPMELVTVKVKGSGEATATNAEGLFSINAKIPSILQFSSVGFKSLELPSTSTLMLVTMESQTDSLDQVVVVGYSRQKKVNLTGAVSVVSGAELSKRPVMNTTVALQGALPGVTVTQANGVPNANGTIRIRGIGTLGNNDPLVLIDGVVAGFNDIDINNIESISVLKDAASASIYGSRAASGVILIASKRGKSGKMKVDYDAFFGTQTPVDKPKYLDAVGFMQMYNEALTNEGGAPRFTDTYINSYMANNAIDPDHYPNTDWQKSTFTNGAQQQHTITLSGGSDRIKLLAAVNYMDQNGIINNSGFKRYSLRLNADYKASDKLSFQFDINLRQDKNIAPSIGYSELFRQVYRVPPIYAAKYSDGSWGPGWEGGNPLAYSYASGVNSTIGNTALINLQANYTPIKGLNINFNFAPNFGTSYNSNNQQKIDYLNFDTKALLFSNPNKVSLSNSNANALTNYLKVQANYTKSFKWLDMSVLTGAEQTDSRTQTFGASRELTLFPELIQLNAYPSLNQNVSGDATSWALRSFYGRINLVASSKYLLEINARYDGSSRFAEDYKRYGFFPSVSAGWIMTREKFLSDVKWLNLLKLRASYGELGNQNIGDYPYISSVTLGQGVLNNNIISVAAQNVVANREITWESTKMLDFGFNAAFFGNKLNVEFDYYVRNTDNILLTLPIPLIVGLSAGVQNAGKVENKGWDLQIGYNDRIGKDFKFGITGVLSDVKNKVIDLKGTGPYISGFQITQEGQEIGSLYGLQAKGLFLNQAQVTASPTQFGSFGKGDISYVDQDNNGVINANDRVIIGSRIPRYTYSANLFFDYKGFDLTLFFQGVGKYNGLQIQDAAWAFFNAGSVRDIHLGRWNPAKTDEENANATYPKFFIAQTNNTQTSSYWVKDASYIKLKTVSIGYTFPATILKKTPFSLFKIYLSGQNVFSWDKFPGYDPEAQLGNPFFYPQVSSYVAGVRMSLK